MNIFGQMLSIWIGLTIVARVSQGETLWHTGIGEVLFVVGIISTLMVTVDLFGGEDGPDDKAGAVVVIVIFLVIAVCATLIDSSICWPFAIFLLGLTLPLNIHIYKHKTQKKNAH